jgi:hypothetical protein
VRSQSGDVAETYPTPCHGGFRRHHSERLTPPTTPPCNFKARQASYFSSAHGQTSSCQWHGKGRGHRFWRARRGQPNPSSIWKNGAEISSALSAMAWLYPVRRPGLGAFGSTPQYRRNSAQFQANLAPSVLGDRRRRSPGNAELSSLRRRRARRRHCRGLRARRSWSA